MWNRLNPFVNRSPHSARKHSPLEILDERQSSVDTVVEREILSSERERGSRNVYSPVHPSTPRKYRTPSILRTLAHHPSLSALRSKPRSKHSNRHPSPLQESSSGLSSQHANVAEGRLSENITSRKLRMQSRSIPRDLRLEGGTIDYTSRTPSLPESIPGSDRATPNRSFSARGYRADESYSYERSVSEVLRVKRMRVEVEIESPRQRVASERLQDDHKERSARSLPSPASEKYFVTSGPKTTQHPHPVPLREREPSDACDPCNFSSSGDLLRHTHFDQRLSDGLELLVGLEELPTGTPGGKKADLKRGALIDGAKHDRHAIRFFSRDTYGQQLSPITSPSPPESRAPVSGSELDKLDGISFGPHDEKLSPIVAKDVPFDISGSPASHNLLSPRTDDLAQEPGPTSQQALANFHGTSLSTIKESPSVRGDLSTALEAAFPPQKVTRSTYELPFASDDARMLLRHSTPKREYRIQSITPTSSPSRESNVPLQEQYPFVPPRHGLAPSLSLTMDLTKSQIQRADRTQNEITQSHFAIDTMEAELYQARTSWGKANDATGSLLAELNGREVLVQRLEGQLAESKRACSDLVEETRAHANTLTDLQAAFHKNRSSFEKLQTAHDDLASRYVDILQEKDSLTLARFQDASTLHAAHIAQETLRQEVKALHKMKDQAASQRIEADHCIMGLQRSLSDTEAQLDATTDDFAAHLASHQDKLSSTQRQLVDRDVLIAELQQANGVAASTGRTATALADSRIAELQMQLLDVREKYKADSVEAAGKLQNALRRLAKKDRTLSILRDKLQTANFENHERQVQYAGLEQEVEELSHLVAEHERAVRAGVGSLTESEEGQWIMEDDLVHLISLLKQSNTEEKSTSPFELELLSKSRPLSNAQRELDRLQAELEETQLNLKAKSDLGDHLDQEVKHLRVAVADAEEALVRAHEDAQRENKESQNTVHHITAQLHDVESQLSTSEWAWKEAVIVSVTEKAKVHDAQSRVEAYLSEIDRLKLVEAGLCEKVDGLRRASALDEIKRIELSKQINELERDKDLLNVALDSKQTELVLLQRSTRSSMVTPRPDRSYPLAASTSRVSQTSSTQDATPVVSRRLSSSASSGYLRSSHTKRELSMNSVPSTPRTGTFARPAPLGSSTKHNRTPEKRPAVKTPVPASIAAKQPELMRRSSLPVSVGRLGSVKVKERFTSMVVEEESVEVLG